MLELDTDSNEGIMGMSSYSYNKSGATHSLEASTTAGRSWGPHGDHTPDDGWTLRKSPNEKLRLCFLSGNQTVGKRILRFHWEPCVE